MCHVKIGGKDNKQRYSSLSKLLLSGLRDQVELEARNFCGFHLLRQLFFFFFLVPTLDWLWLPAAELSRKKCCDRLLMSALGVEMSFDSRAPQS